MLCVASGKVGEKMCLGDECVFVIGKTSLQGSICNQPVPHTRGPRLVCVLLPVQTRLILNIY